IQAEERFQQQWNHFNAVTGETHLKLRALTNGLGVWCHTVQTGVYASTVLIGAPMVIAGDMTTGALVAASILGSRMMAPMSPPSHVLGRGRQAKVPWRSLTAIMQRPGGHPERESRSHGPSSARQFRLRSAAVRSGDQPSPVASS